MMNPHFCSLEKALELALEAHRGQTDKAGAPYILHPLRLMSRFQDETAQTVALLHDVVEDGNITLDALAAHGFSADVVHAVDCLTRRRGESYEDFIQRAGSDPLARRVKVADIEDNLSVLRLPSLGEKDLQRVAKYHRAWHALISQ